MLLQLLAIQINLHTFVFLLRQGRHAVVMHERFLPARVFFEPLACSVGMAAAPSIPTEKQVQAPRT